MWKRSGAFLSQLAVHLFDRYLRIVPILMEIFLWLVGLGSAESGWVFVLDVIRASLRKFHIRTDT